MTSFLHVGIHGMLHDCMQLLGAACVRVLPWVCMLGMPGEHEKCDSHTDSGVTAGMSHPCWWLQHSLER